MMKKKTYKAGGSTKDASKKKMYGGEMSAKEKMAPKGPKKMKMGGSTKTKTKK